MTLDFERRLTPLRQDLAAEDLVDLVAAPRFARGRMQRVVLEAAPMRRSPDPEASLDTYALFGEEVVVYEERGGWAWGQLVGDGYVGYLAAGALGPVQDQPTHRVAVPRTFVYPTAGMKLPPLMALPLNAEVSVAARDGNYARLATGGHVFAEHLKPREQPEEDFVAVAESYLGVPYLWGGKTSLGLDCSGLVQIALASADMFAPRDTDLMQRALGYAIDIGEELAGARRGDIVFWKGHVGLMRDGAMLLHASGHHMQVVSEPLRRARDRIRAANAGTITSVRRLNRPL